jgi:hypothetical protein
LLHVACNGIRAVNGVLQERSARPMGQVTAQQLNLLSGSQAGEAHKEESLGLRLPAFLRPGKRVFMDKYATIKRDKRERK